MLIGNKKISTKFNAHQENVLDQPLRYVKGVGEYLSKLFQKKEILTLRDALYFFPRTYEDRRQLFQVSEMRTGQRLSVLGKIYDAHPVYYARSKKRAFEVILHDAQGKRGALHLHFFRAPYVKSQLTAGTYLIVTGEVKWFRSTYQMIHPEMELLGKVLKEENSHQGIFPIYSETEGLFQKTIRRVLHTVISQYATKLEDSLPISFLQKHEFPLLKEAVQQLHCPAPESDFAKLLLKETPAHQRMIYEEFLVLALALAVKRKQYTHKEGYCFLKPEKCWGQLKQKLSFTFTSAQRRVLKEILDDMISGRVMHRLVQGDVGCGKTVVAAASALVAVESGFQVAFMAPTEILIEQHFQQCQKWFETMGLVIEKLTGATHESRTRESQTRDRGKILQNIASGKANIIFGTHALFEDQVLFSKLGLVIVDEQHRFGVEQRNLLIQKGKNPHVLVMTATPIPRTLALTLYGDLDISVIDEMPPFRKPVITKVFVEKQRAALEKEILKQLHQGRQIYIIFPLIEESEKMDLRSIEEMLPHLQKIYSQFRVVVLHGKMDTEEKEKVLQAFKRMEIQVLVSTTVVEVGVDVPNATVMVVEHAERFGLSQLHQLRGRVGRADHQSYCFLMTSFLGNSDATKRLKTLEKVSDGFRLAEIDLKMRGAGEFLGKKQSGMIDFKIAELPRDYHWFEMARHDALKLLETDPELKSCPLINQKILRMTASVDLN